MMVSFPILIFIQRNNRLFCIVLGIGRINLECFVYLLQQLTKRMDGIRKKGKISKIEIKQISKARSNKNESRPK
jgi:hypothetical protein